MKDKDKEQRGKYQMNFKCCCCDKVCVEGEVGGGGNPEPLKDINGNCLARISNDNVVCETCDQIVVVHMRMKKWFPDDFPDYLDKLPAKISEIAGAENIDKYLNIIKRFENNDHELTK